MKIDIHKSYVSVPLPTGLYVNLVDQMSKANMDCEPASMVTSILQKYLDNAQTKLPGQNSMESATDWSNDWIMYGSPPPLTKDNAPKFKKKSKKRSSTDWCIGSNCPSLDLLSQ
jgi:hypothetical protein